MNKVNPFPALTAPRSLIFLSNLYKTDEVILKTKLLITLSNVLTRNPPERIILDNFSLLKNTSVDMLLAKAFLILVFFVLLLEIIYVAILILKYFLSYS